MSRVCRCLSRSARAHRPPITAPATAYLIVVSFISTGEGPGSVAQFTIIVAEFEQTRGPVEHIVSPWGREGEVDVCFTLAGLAPAQRNERVGQRLAVTEQQPCSP